MKKITLDKIVAVSLPVAWFSLLWFNPDIEWYFRIPMCFLVGASVPILWHIQKLKELAFERGEMQERLRQCREKYEQKNKNQY